MTQSIKPEGGGLTRRQFAAAAAATAMSFAITRRAQAGVESIGIGFIGAGGRGANHMECIRYLRDEEKVPVDLAAVCDIYRPRLEARKAHYGIPKAYKDYRELLADPRVDVVCISTPDHQHGYQAIDALKAGKHVYCEKPVTHWRQFELTRQLADVAAASDCVFLLGTQAMSDSVWRQMKKLVQEDGIIGQPVFGETGFFRIGDWGERGMPIDDPNAKPGDDLDWEAFQGDAPRRPFSADRFFRWRLFEDYAGGLATDLYPHCLTQVVDILNVGFPETVAATAGIHRYEYRLREVPDTINILAQYPEKITIAVLGTQANDYNTTPSRGSSVRSPVIRGWDGTLTIDKNTIVFTPVRVSGAKAPQTFPIEKGESQTEYWKHMLDCCMRGDKKTWSDMDLAFRTQTILHMAIYSAREAKIAKFDQEKRCIIL